MLLRFIAGIIGLCVSDSMKQAETRKRMAYKDHNEALERMRKPLWDREAYEKSWERRMEQIREIGRKEQEEQQAKLERERIEKEERMRIEEALEAERIEAQFQKELSECKTEREYRRVLYMYGRKEE